MSGPVRRTAPWVRVSEQPEAATSAETDSFSLRRMGAPTVLLTMAGLTGQFFALVRTLFVAGQVGTSSELDALLVALALPVVVSGFLSSSLRAALVPAYLDLEYGSGRRSALVFAGAIVTWAATAGILAALLLMLLAGPAVLLAGPGLDAGARELAIRYIPIVAPILGLVVLTSLLGALCQAIGRFRPIAVTVAVSPLVTLLLTIWLWDRYSLDGLAIALTAGPFVGLLLMMGSLARLGMLPPIGFRIDRRALGRFTTHAAPLTAGAAVLQFNLLADRAVASLLSPGAVSALNYGQQIVTQPVASANSAWTTVSYPQLVQAAQGHQAGSLGASAHRAIRFTLVVFVPLAVATAALAPLIVDVIYRRGAFDSASAAATSGVVAAFAPILVLTMVQPIVTGSLNARRRGRLLGLTAVLNAALNVTLNVAFGIALGVAGVALSTSVTVALLLVWLGVRMHEPGFDGRGLLRLTARTTLASLVPAIPLAIGAWLWLPVLPFLAAAGLLVVALVVVLVGYLIGAEILGIEEPRALLAVPMRLVAKRMRGT